MPSVANRLLAGAALSLGAALAQAGELHVSAAASLTEAFQDLARGYEARHAGTRVLLNFGASGGLLQQMARGAPVDVFASADSDTMDLAAGRRLVDAGARREFAGNRLVVVVPGASRLALGRIPDLVQPAVRRIAIGNPASVPAGRYARDALQAAGLWSGLAARLIQTQSVRQSLAYVARGEVEAGFVYGTDAAVMRDKVRVAFEVPLANPIRYPIAPAAASADPAQARRFIDYVMSPDGQALLAAHGFRKP